VVRENGSNDLLLAILLFFAALGVFLVWRWLSPMILDFTGFFVAVYIGFLILGIFHVMRWRSPVPNRVYENGIQHKNILGWGVFIPFGQFTECDEHRVGSLRTLWVKGPGQLAVSLDHDIPDYHSMKALIRSRIGNPKYDAEEYHHYRIRMMKVGQLLLAVTAVTAGFFLYLILPQIEDVSYSSVLEIVSWTSMSALVTYSMIIIGFVNSNMYFVPRRRFSTSFTTSFIAVLIAIWLGTSLYLGLPYQVPELSVATTDDHGMDGLVPGEYEGLNLSIIEPIGVRDGETLMLTGCNVTMAMDDAINRSIWVGEGGQLVLRNTTIMTSASSPGYSIEVHGSALFEDSIMRAPGRALPDGQGDGGLILVSDDVTLSRVEFSGATSNAIVVSDHSPTIEGCVFLDVVGDGIVMDGGTALVKDCRFEGNGRGIVIFRGGQVVEGCSFISNGVGCVINHGTPAVNNSTFEGTERQGILWYDPAEPVLEGNQFSSNGVDVGRDSWGRSWVVTAMATIPVLMGFIAIFGIVRIVRKLPPPRPDVESSSPLPP
jgi:hypothetical protein